MTIPTATETAVHLLEDRVIKIAEDMKVDPTPLALYLILKDLRATALREKKDLITVKILELGMINQLKQELDDAGL